MKWYQDGQGKVSALRILAMGAGIVGMIITLAGAVGMFLDKASCGTAMTVGAGMVATALGAKAWQKRSESMIEGR